MSSTTLTIDQLCLSPFNVRTNEEDATATRALEASILARGLILPLVVHPMRGSTKHKYGVYAGGRRYRSIRRLVDRAALPADWPVDVVIRDLPEAELIEVSAAENLLRRDLRPYELFAAVARAHRKGDKPEKIAETLGQEISWVRQSLRLGNLAKPIFDALEAGEISVDQARAYAGTEDQALQLATFEQLQPLPPHQKDPAKIRAAMRIGDLEAGRLLRFVGAVEYRAQGGRFELDLFADGATERGRIVDEKLLRELVDAKLGGVRETIRVETARKDLRFVTQPPQSEFGTDFTLQITPKRNDAGTLALPDGDVVAWISIPESGKPDVTYWWTSRRAKYGLTKSAARTPTTASAPRHALRTGIAINDGASPGAQRQADAAIKEEAGLSQVSVQIMRTLRRGILRAMLLDDARDGGAVGLDYLVWSQLRLALTNDHAAQVGMRPLDQDRSAAVDFGRDVVRATEAQRLWDHALSELHRRPCLSHTDLQTAFISYRSEPPATKNLAAAVVAGVALERSLNADGYQLPTHDALASMMGGYEEETLRRYWTPTSEFLDLLPAKDRLAIAEPLVEAAAFAPWTRVKAGEITGLVLSALTGATGAVRRTMREAAARWVHPLLRFGPTDAAADLREAAE